MDKFFNDMSFFWLGDQYYYLVVLEECLNVDLYEIVFIE